MATGSFEAKELAEEGIALCKKGDWDLGIQLLGRIVEDQGVSKDMPGTAYSFLGFGVAKRQRRIRDGLRLCEHAVKVQFYEPDNHWNLARVRLLANDRRGAVRAIARGLKLDPNHRGLRGVREEIGVRRRPTIPFLSRDNVLNRLLGRMRHDFSKE